MCEQDPREKLNDKLALLPSNPGVYIMKNAEGEVIYVGKAISLKNRVRQYFRSSKNHGEKVRAMVSHITDFETIEVASENEALSLESNLIKQYKPKYNILLKDDKHFPYVRIDLKQDFPRVEVARRIKQDGASYLGPFPSEVYLREQMNLVREHFPLRHCKKDLKKAVARRERPCLMYQVGKCCAPCSGKVTRQEYHGYVRQIMSFLNGNTAALEAELKERMEKAAEELDFESASVYRDRIVALTKLSERQAAISAKPFDADVFAVARLQDAVIVYAMFVRLGKIIGSRHYEMANADAREDGGEGEVLSAFLTQLYDEDALPAQEVLLYDDIGATEALSEWLSEKAGRKVRLHIPQRGEKRTLCELAHSNGEKLLQKENELQKRAWERDGGALEGLAALIGLNTPPERMECFDNSHTMGTNTVSSMVVFTNGKPDKQEYRRYKIRAEAHGDDLTAMREALTRRFKKDGQRPDLLIVDGGKTQLAVAEAVLAELEIQDVPAVGLAEEHEYIYISGKAEPVILPRSSAVLHLVERIRDEAHRYAISYHRLLSNRTMLYSRLDEVPGIGDARKRALFDTFLTLDAMRNASVEELAKVKGMTLPAAIALHDSLNSDNKSN